jgi:hypothetical protein
MAEGKFDMHAGSGTLVERTLLLVNLQPAQTGSAMSSCCQRRRAEARRWHRVRQNLGNGRSKFDMVLAKFYMSSTSKFQAKKNSGYGLQSATKRAATSCVSQRMLKQTVFSIDFALGIFAAVF